MKIINQYTSFYLGELLFSIKEQIDITNFITQSFPSSFIIKIKIKNDVINFDLEGNFYDTEVKGLTWRHFSNEFLLKIKELLNVEVREALNMDHRDNLIIYYKEKKLNIALKTFDSKKYAVIYNLDLPDVYRGAGVFSGSLYIHGIFEID
jgi:hypothetical protein